MTHAVTYSAEELTANITRMKAEQAERIGMIRQGEEAGNQTIVDLFTKEVQYFGNLIINLENRRMMVN